MSVNANVTVIASPDLAILRWLARRTGATASQIGAACAMAPGETRGRLVVLKTMRLVSGRQDSDEPGRVGQRVHYVTAEGRRKVGVSDARTQ